jgi:hypothetical protein
MVTFILFSPVAPLLAAVLVGGILSVRPIAELGVRPEIENSSLHGLLVIDHLGDAAEALKSFSPLT